MTTLEGLRCTYAAAQALGLDLDMTRGKPSPEQLALSEPLLTLRNTHTTEGVDCRNYGGNLVGLAEARELFGNILGVSPSDVIVGGNSSLALMHDIIVQALLQGMHGEPWALGHKPAFLCPVPGYDRHFAICERYGIIMIPIPMDEHGPNMRMVLEQVQDPSVVGMWCVPKYSNPTGCTYSAKTVDHLAGMRPSNPRFRIFWDNAYAAHDLTDTHDVLSNIMESCRRYGTRDRAFIFGSTSKITFAGGGIAAVAMSERNREWYLDGLRCQTIGHNKLNQLRHVLFFAKVEGGIRGHMARHREILRPKFDTVEEALSTRLGDKPHIATWTRPRGGYFVSIEAPGCARRVVELAASAGVKLTPEGATFPYGIDPDDSNIRIAPSFPTVEEVRTAMEIVALCIELAYAERTD